MLNTPFSPWPSFSEEEIEAVSAVLRTGRINYWTGNECREFEKEFAEWCGVRHAVALANGSVALDLAMKVLGIGDGDEVVVTPRTFLASASTVVNAGARPVFADVDRDTQGISAQTIAPVLSPRTKAILCVHLAGKMAFLALGPTDELDPGIVFCVLANEVIGAIGRTVTHNDPAQWFDRLSDHRLERQLDERSFVACRRDNNVGAHIQAPESCG